MTTYALELEYLFDEQIEKGLKWAARRALHRLGRQKIIRNASQTLANALNAIAHGINMATLSPRGKRAFAAFNDRLPAVKVAVDKYDRGIMLSMQDNLVLQDALGHVITILEEKPHDLRMNVWQDTVTDTMFAVDIPPNVSNARTIGLAATGAVAWVAADFIVIKEILEAIL